jgi:hypothetical protein
MPPRTIDAFAKHVELLRPLLTAAVPFDVTPHSATPEERLLLVEMKDAGFIDCINDYDERGFSARFANLTITSAGRALVAEFDAVLEPEGKKTSWPMISALIALAVFAAAVIWRWADSK